MSRPNTHAAAAERPIELLRAIDACGPKAHASELLAFLGGAWKQSRLDYWRRVLTGTGCIVNRGTQVRRDVVLTERGRRCLAGDLPPPQSRELDGRPEVICTGEAKRRACLTCGNEFPSGWPGERICPSCKDTKAWRSPAAAAVVAQEVC